MIKGLVSYKTFGFIALGQYTGRTALVAAHLLEPAIQCEATQAEVFGSQ
jgi:hypothetical protein